MSLNPSNPGGGLSFAPETRAAPVRDWLDLSLAQRAVWLDASLAASPSAYTLVRWGRISGDLDPELARQALTLVVARHDALRLRADSELPRQWLHASAQAPFEFIDLSAARVPEAALQSQIDELLAAGLPFGDRPLFYFDLFRLGAGAYYVLVRCHHLLADEAAVALIFGHWLAACRALSSDVAAELPPTSSYLTVIAADAAYLASPRYKADGEYWLARFGTLPPPLVQPRDAAATGMLPNTFHWTLEGPAYRRFTAAAAAAETTPQRAIFALFAVVLGRRYGQSDITLGMALHRRDAVNMHVVGMLAGTIAVRHQLGAESLLDTVRAIHRRIDADLRHARFPIDELSRIVGISRDGLADLFVAAVSFLPAARGPADAALDNLTLRTGSLPSTEASPLTLHASELAAGAGIAFDLAAHPAIADAAQVQRIMQVFTAAIEIFVEQPGTPVEAFAAITPDERALVVDVCNATAATYPDQTADALFEQQVRATPDAAAVLGIDQTVSYRQLEARANALARRLVARGARPQSVVGVALQRSVETVVALLAILKVGCIYLPLDPAYPRERLAHMLADSGAALVLTDETIAALLPASVPRLIGGPAPDPDAMDIGAPARSHTPAHAAYIIYTSGSTGQPKGVAVPHAAAVNLAFARHNHDPIGTGDRILAAISVGFDVSIGQLLLPLLSGATIVIAADLRTLAAHDFWAFVGDFGVTHINSVPSYFESVLDAAPPAASLVRLMLGGEPLSGALVRRLRAALPHTQVINMYGPTEACIDATAFAAGDGETAAVLPIGKPLPNYRAYILDAQLDPVGVGIAGDLYLGGAGLAHGYLNAPALTAERFVANPFGAVGERLYKTGDRAARRPDGHIEFLGRADSQIKIRGHRIELGEIENALRSHPAVAQAAVVAATDVPGPARLIAYVVTRGGAVPHSAELREHLADRLPDYMIPAAFCPLDALPLTPNGKVDHRALPRITLQSATAYVEPRTANERLVAMLFVELLDIAQAGARDDFFELGGHSLLASRLVSQLRARANAAIPLRAVFESPTVEGLARLVDVAGYAGALVPASRPDRLPTAFAQERLWFVSRLQQDDAYNIPLAIRLRGALDAERMIGALTELVARHEALRTCIVMHDGRPMQDIREPAAFAAQRIDVTHLPAADRTAAAAQRLGALARTAFDLAVDLPIRAALITLDADEHVVAAVIHHASFDGWSAALFLRELGQLYGADAAALAPPVLQYADFALWQRGLDFASDLAYWQQRLAGAPPVLDFPTDRAAVAHRSPARMLPLHIDETLCTTLAAFAKTRGASLFMVLHAALATLLARWTGQSDIVIGTVVANRARAEFERIIGCFVNTLALRTMIGPRDTLADILADVREHDLAAFEHQAVPFERVVDALRVERSLARTPLFQTMLVLDTDTLPDVTLPGLASEPITLAPAAAKVDITLNLRRTSGAGIAGNVEFAADLFEPATIERFAGHFVRLLAAFAADPHQVARRAAILGADERARVIDEWNVTHAVYDGGTLDGLFSAQSRRTPNAPAVIDTAASFDYAALDARSNGLANHLIERGMRPQTPIGVALERSAASVVALLAILKAGCIYVPLDPAYPAERIAHMLADSGAGLIITDAAQRAMLPVHIDWIDVDAGSGLSTVAPLRAHQPQSVAYIIYTSGSSGKPKGVAVPHAAAVNLAFARREHDPIGAGDRILAAVSVGFDVSIGQLLLPLISGAAVVVADDLRTLTAAQFWEFLAANAVTHINSVPSFFDSILDAAPPTTGLVRLMLGGEPLSPALVRRLRRALPQTQIFNMYGPTEACIDATAYRASGDETDALLPIGKPLPNYRAYILDAMLEPVGIAVAGELYLAGAGLAHGYVNAPALTAERFVPDPFGAPGERLYKTGDRARRLASGDIEFLGRLDKQVKIRGHRIELGEIEAALTALPAVREAAVIVREDSPGERRLIAYYTTHAAPDELRGDPAFNTDATLSNGSADALRAALATILPGYMLPAAFIALAILPLTTNGKLDRSALPAPGDDAYAARIFEPPQGDAETRIAAIFAAALGRERVGRNENFFELGGHSLLAMTVIERMRQNGLQLDVRNLFRTPTVAGLAGSARDAADLVDVPPNRVPANAAAITPDMLALIELEPAEIETIVAAVPGGAPNVQDLYPLAPLQEGVLFRHLMVAEGDAYLTPVLLGFDRRGRLELFLDALREMIARHDILRTAILWENLSKPVQVVVRGADLPVEELGVDPASDAAEQLRARFDPRHFRIDIRQAPLLRAFIAHDAVNDRWLLMLLNHHLILDHNSLDIILHEVKLISAGRLAELPPSEPFRNFVAQARLGVPSAEHEAFFRAMLAGIDEPTLPYGAVNVQADGTKIRESSRALGAVLSMHVRQRARALGVGPATLFHLAWALVVAHAAGRTDVVFGTLLFGRMYSAAGTARTLGMFINTLPMRIAIDRTGVESAVLETHARLAELLRHEHAPLALAQRCSGVPAPAPLFSSLFNFRHSPAADAGAADAAWPGVELIFAQERTDYPIALAIDDRNSDFLLTAQVDAPIDPAGICLTVETALGNLLAALEAAPATELRAIGVLPIAEREHVTAVANATAADYSSGTADELFAQAVLRVPDAAALIHAGDSLTYAQLDARSNGLANHLIERGMRPQTPIGVALERSAASVVALLAILKAGCIYVPLDPAYPAERIAYMLADSGAGLIITDAAQRAMLPVHIDWIDVDAGSGLSTVAPLRAHQPQSVAYIIYTSGSSGKPKGVAVPHAAAVNLAFARREHDPIGAGDRILAAVSVGFDVSIGQLLLPLISGAAVVVADDLRTLTAAQFWEFLAANAVTHINSVPSFFDSILDAAPPTTGLVRLMLGGEPLSPALVRRLRRALPQTQIFNMYGPTEACIDATAYRASGDETDALLPIGKPLPNYRAYILDAMLEPVGIAVAGELYLAGAGLAHGYVNAPALTAERFVPDPFGAPGERLYKTGDRARRLASGDIEFLGRLDKQVKIRGHRIELGEIEAALTALPAVREAAVIVREDSPGERRLIAYYTTHAAPDELRGDPAFKTDATLSNGSADALRAALATILPGYMLPAAFIALAILPLTTNGKLDRSALPAPGDDAYAARIFEPPQGDAETRIAAIFAAALGRERVGRNENFFELGGHSLLAMTVIERMRQNGLQLDVRNLFRTPTVAGLAGSARDAADDFVIPPNLIEPGTTAINPAMLPLIRLDEPDIETIVAAVAGGASNVQDIYPLAPLQEGILFRHLMTEQGDAYLTPFLMAFDRRGRLELFLDALREMIARHDILRTAILWENLSKPVQVVVRGADLPVDYVVLDDTERADPVHALRGRFDPQHFRIDIRRAPMLRAFVTHDAAADRWLLMLVSHHLILDHTSLEVILHEVGLISTGRRAALPAPKPFRNFVARAQFGIPQAEHEAFFRTLLGDIDEPTAPYGLLSVQAAGTLIRDANVALDAGLSNRMRECARTLGVGPATIFHLAWALVVAHATGRTDVVFGTLLFGRMAGGDGAQRTLGMFINTLPLRTAVDATSVEAGVVRMHRTLADLLRHEHAPLALAQRCSGVPAPSPLFSSLFNFRHSAPADPAEAQAAWPGVKLLFAQERTDYPVALAIDDRGADFLITAQSDAPIDPARICRSMETATLNLLTALESAPQTHLRRIGVLPSADYALAVVAPNATAVPYSRATLHALFTAQADRTPDAVALTSIVESLTYAEVEARSHALAARLARYGVRAQDTVGVALPRSATTVVALLAILKIGATYVPLDPAYPAERIAYMLGDAAVHTVITDISTAALLPATVERVVCVDRADVSNVSEDGAAEPALAAARVGPDDVAYIIYTSGSSGKPKGVAVPHAAAVNLAFARREHDPIGAGDRILAAVSVGFDVSIGQLLLPLISGAAVVVADDLRTLTAAQFWEFLAANAVTHINSVPSFFDSILDAAPPTTGLVRLMLGGEPLSPALVRRLRRALPQTQIFNMYGPTEACIDATAYRASGDETDALLPIGKPLPNYRAYILDAMLEPVGIAVAGELYLAGAGLAHGYVNAPALTAERFVPDPFGAPGERLYKTGDRARRLASGDIEFLGRLDKQVKIRGHRIELGEIEAALLDHPAIAATAVIAVADPAGPARLAAYIVTTTGMATPAAAELRAQLADRLPDYMMPSAFVSIAALPVTANGKLDIDALPTPSVDRTDDVAYEPPRSAPEIAMQSLWRVILGVTDVGRNDNFFALGGHSLAAMRLIAACNATFGTALPLRVLFEAPTIARLTAMLAPAVDATSDPVLVPLRTDGAALPLFCIHPAGGHVFCYAPLVQSLRDDVPVYGLQARGLEQSGPPAVSIAALAADYVHSIRRVQADGPYRLLGMSSGGLIAYEMAHQLEAAGERVSLLALLDTSLPDSNRATLTQAETVRALAGEFGVDDLCAGPLAPTTIAGLLERARIAERLPSGIDLDLAQRVVAVFLRTVELCAQYTLAARTGHAVLFRALKRDTAGDSAPDWSHYLAPSALTVDLMCTHGDLMSVPLAPVIAAHLEPYL